MTQPAMETVQAPVTDTAIVQTEITIDTMIDTDTVVRETDVTAVPDTSLR